MPRFSRAIWNELKGLTDHEVEVIKRFESDPRGTMFVSSAEVLRKRGCIDEAIVIMEDGIRNFPQYYSARAALGRDYYLKGMMVEARYHLGIVVQKSVDNVVAQRLKLKVDILFNDRNEVRNRLNICKQLFPDDAFTAAVRDMVTADDWEGVRTLVHSELQRFGIKWSLDSESQSTERALERLQTEAEKKPTKEKLQSEWSIPSENEVTQTSSSIETRELNAAQESIHAIDESKLPLALRTSSTLASVRGDIERYLCLRGFRRVQSEGLFSQGVLANSNRNVLDNTTLAEIYVTQGLVAKAISIYERLVKSQPDVEHHQRRLRELLTLASGGRPLSETRPAFSETPNSMQAKANRMTPETEKKLRFLESLLNRLDSPNHEARG